MKLLAGATLAAGLALPGIAGATIITENIVLNLDDGVFGSNSYGQTYLQTGTLDVPFTAIAGDVVMLHVRFANGDRLAVTSGATQDANDQIAFEFDPTLNTFVGGGALTTLSDVLDPAGVTSSNGGAANGIRGNVFGMIGPYYGTPMSFDGLDSTISVGQDYAMTGFTFAVQIGTIQRLAGSDAPSDVPEPASLGFMGMALASIVVGRRKRNV